jgi:hypothetical protein
MATVCHFLPHKPGVFAHTAEAIIWIFAAIDIECVILTYKECVAFNSLKRVPSDTYTVKLTGPFIAWLFTAKSSARNVIVTLSERL